MKQTSHSILGRLAKATAVGCLLALVFLATTSVQSKTSAKARPFKATAIYTAGYNTAGEIDGTFRVAGNATHLGNFVGKGTFEFAGMSEDGLKMFLHVTATWTAANGDTITIDYPKWVADNSVDPPTSTGVGKIIGGTGRFANASGSIFTDISPAALALGVINILTAEGTISY